MECKRCGNSEEEYFYYDSTTWYCRKCIMFGRIDVGCEPIKKEYMKVPLGGSYTLPFTLKQSQINASKMVLSMLEKKDVLVYAACGAGKTEIAMEVIQQYSSKGAKVGFAISRRQVVLEIYHRLSEAFIDRSLCVVCEGYNEVIDADIILCTMHQLYRYVDTFDLLIMDEVDAFPYKGNPLLEKIAMASCKGRVVYLTATPTDDMFQQVKKDELAMVTLFERPHGFDLVVPKVYWSIKSVQGLLFMMFIKKQLREGKQGMIFVPSKNKAKALYIWLHRFVKISYVTSDKKDKDEVIEKFKAKELQFLITTTLMERGITIEDVQVIVIDGEHDVFDCASLLQIVGRVGRKASAPSGDAWILCSRKTKAIQVCVSSLKKMNDEKMQTVF